MRSSIQFIAALALWSGLVIFGGCGNDEGTDPITSAEEFETYLKQEMEDENMPALATLIFKDDQVLYESYLGKSQLVKDVDLEPDHLFLMASVSKVFTATALLQLYDSGLFDLDDSINAHLDFRVSIPDDNTPITFRMLLTHTSAIADGSALDDQYYYGEDSPVALSDFMRDYFSPGGKYYDERENFHNLSPGEEHEYSNVASALIGVLVEEISGQGFNEYCKEHFFKPLKMEHTAWRLDEIAGTIAQPYNYKRGDYEALEHYTFTDYPNGGLRSTARDLAVFFNAFINEGTTVNIQLLKAETAAEMATPQLADKSDGVGLHMFRLNDEHSLWGHDGGESGVATIVGFNKSTHIGVVLLCNQGDANLDNLLAEAYQFGLSF